MCLPGKKFFTLEFTKQSEKVRISRDIQKAVPLN